MFQFLDIDHGAGGVAGHRFQRCWILEGGAANDADDLGVGMELAGAGRLKNSRDGGGGGGFGEQAFFLSETRLCFEDQFVGDDVTGATAGATGGNDFVPVDQLRDLQSADF